MDQAISDTPIDRQLETWIKTEGTRLGANPRLIDELTRSVTEQLLINYGASTVYVRGRRGRDKTDYSAARKAYDAKIRNGTSPTQARIEIMRKYRLSRATFYRRVVREK